MSSGFKDQKDPSAGKKRLSRKGWVFLFSFSLVLNFSLGLGLVWINQERTNLGYSLKELQVEVDTLADQGSKLEVERDLLLSPRNLERQARSMGLGTARPGQVRRMD